ncbi:hypothetical protein ADK52_04875 [Streptomyces sp. WM6372]|nr:hypothetical protein ADK52_04875 [Streptomyces sp. WM6372]
MEEVGGDKQALGGVHRQQSLSPALLVPERVEGLSELGMRWEKSPGGRDRSGSGWIEPSVWPWM